MIHSIFNSVMGFGITGILVAIIGFWLFGRFVKGIITNIVLGGVLYLFLDWFHICNSRNPGHNYSCHRTFFILKKP